MIKMSVWGLVCVMVFGAASVGAEAPMPWEYDLYPDGKIDYKDLFTFQAFWHHTSGPSEVFSFQLIHASDFEAGIAAIDDASAFSAVLTGLREWDPERTLALSSGDNFISGTFFSAGGDASMRSVLGREGPGRADISILNAMRFQASVLGNHEFDQGTESLASLIQPDHDYPGIAFPYISANLDFSNDPYLASLVVPDGQSPQAHSITKSLVLEIDDEQIGVVGLTTPELPWISSPGQTVIVSPTEAFPINYPALAAIAQSKVNELTEQGINKIILVTHLQEIEYEQTLAPLLYDVDIIVAGGSHKVLANENDRLREDDVAMGPYPILTESLSGDPVAIVNTGPNYRYVGRLVASFDEQGVLLPDLIDVAVSGPFATDAQGVAESGFLADPRVAEICEAIGAVVTVKDGNIFGKTDVYLDAREVTRQESNLGNLASDANLARGRIREASVMIALNNAGAIRASIGVIDPHTYEPLPPLPNPKAGKLAGEVSQLDVENTLKFNNPLALITVTASQLLEVFEHSVAESTAEANTFPGQFPQIAGMAFSFDPRLPAGQRVRSLAVHDHIGQATDVVVEQGAVVGDPARPFRMISSSFLTAGGSGYPFQQYVDANPTLAHRVLLTDVAHPVFDTDGSEQHSLATYLDTYYSVTPFQEAETPPQQDGRIQNLMFRDDTVLENL